MNKNGLILILLALLGLGYWYFQKKQHDILVEENASILLEKIEEVNKLILVEGSFAEIYNYSQAENIFFDLLPVQKKVLVIVKAKVSVGYDLSMLGYIIDKDLQQVIITSIPREEIIIEPEIQYYDVQQSQFYPLDGKDLTTINKRALELIKNQVKASSLPKTAEARLKEVLEQIVFTGNTLGWSVIEQ